MERHRILMTSRPASIRVRGSGMIIEQQILPAPPVSAPKPAQFPQEVRKTPAAPPEPDLRPLLEAIGNAVSDVEQRRQQSLGELQHVAIELAISVASQLVFESLSREQFGVDELVRQAVDNMGLNGPITITLHPTDLTLLQKRLAKTPGVWKPSQVELKGDTTVGRGSCHAESPEGRMIVSEMTSRLSEIRRHWLEELDDAQIERRRTAGEGAALRRFPDRRETA